MNIFEYNFIAIDGLNMPLSRWQGQPIFIVNTASQCGFTPQYKLLQNMWRDYKEGGLVVVGIPSNDFGEQEPGDEEVIAQFCDSNYAIDFPMTQKMSVIGRDAHPMYIAIGEEMGSDFLPKWNFHKYLFDRAGEMVNGWPSGVEPNDPQITHSIERYMQSWIL